MVQDESVDPSQSVSQPLPPPGRSPAGRRLLLGGVALACLAGAGVGLWARPSDLERPESAQAQPTALPVKAPDRRLAIVVDDTPAPVGRPLDVLTRPAPPAAVQAPASAILPPPAAAEPVAPKAAPNGLVRVVAPSPGPLGLAKPPTPAAIVRPLPPPVVAAPRPAPPRPVAAKPAIAKPVVAKPVVAKPVVAKPAARVAQTERHKPDRHKAERLAKAAPKHRAREIEVAEQAPPARPVPRPHHGLSALAHAFAKLAPHHAKAATAEPAAREASAQPRHKARTEAVARAESPKPAKAPAAGARCASADPGEALACGDPNLAAADRRLSRAYREAEAAGVPAATLERQQQRWRTARAAAAREAPWAVREVYQARIAELQDQARSARGQ